MSNKKTTLESMLAQYESATTETKSKTSFDLKNYFTTYLPDGINSAIKRVRILPINDGGTPFMTVYVHSITVDGKNRKFTCLAHQNDEPCPFCEAREELLSTGKESDKELAKNYRPKLMYIAKVIDRENEADGPKFWRFPSNYKKEGILDKIMANVRMLGVDVTDAVDGWDLALNVERIKNPRGGTYPSVTSILAPKSGPLSTNAEQAKSWVDDTKQWSDVYSMKPYDYLAIIVKGGVPTWSKAKEKYVDKNDLDSGASGNVSDELESELTMGGSKTDSAKESVNKEIETVKEVDFKTDDLPF